MDVMGYGEMIETAAEWFDGPPETSRAEAQALLAALGIGSLVETIEVMTRIIVTADTYHAVARFFVEGSPEQELILEILGRRS